MKAFMGKLTRHDGFPIAMYDYQHGPRLMSVGQYYINHGGYHSGKTGVNQFVEP